MSLSILPWTHFACLYLSLFQPASLSDRASLVGKSSFPLHNGYNGQITICRSGRQLRAAAPRGSQAGGGKDARGIVLTIKSAGSILVTSRGERFLQEDGRRFRNGVSYGCHHRAAALQRADTPGLKRRGRSARAHGRSGSHRSPLKGHVHFEDVLADDFGEL